LQSDEVIDFRLGRYQDVLHDVVCDAVICDPPYGQRTHDGHNVTTNGHIAAGNDSAIRRQLSYAAWGPDEVHQFVSFWSRRVRGWFCVLTSHDLSSHYEASLLRVNRYVFQPLPCVMRGMTVRLSGDGPSSWTVWLVVARPKTKEFATWGTLDGAYTGTPQTDFIGGKPLWLMNAIIRDYSKPGDLICDPCAGGATTLIAAASQGRRAVGAEMDVETYKKAQQRIEAGYTQDMYIT